MLVNPLPAQFLSMYKWSFTLQGPGGLLSTLESGETQFVLGTEQAADVWTIAGEGVAVRHALVRVAAGRMQVEDLAGGTLVNGHPITGRGYARSADRNSRAPALADSDSGFRQARGRLHSGDWQVTVDGGGCGACERWPSAPEWLAQVIKFTCLHETAFA